MSALCGSDFVMCLIEYIVLGGEFVLVVGTLSFLCGIAHRRAAIKDATEDANEIDEDERDTLTS